MRLRFWRRPPPSAEVEVQVPQPRQKGRSEAEAATERALADLAEARGRRRAEIKALTSQLDREMARNHIAEAITATFRGGHA